jgi:hypothetical protein
MSGSALIVRKIYCQKDLDRHTNDCPESNEWSYLKEDMDSMIDVLGVMEENLHEESTFSGDGRDYIGRRTKKEFDGIFFEGKVSTFADKEWTVKYSDGVTEEFIWDDLKLLLLKFDKDAS